MNSAATVSAAQLLDADETDQHPPPKQKLYAADFPGVEITPAYPNATYGRHPVTKQFVSLKPKPGAPVPVPQPPKPPPEPAEPANEFKFVEPPERPLNTGPEPPLAAPVEPAEPAATTAPAEPAAPVEPPPPDFSDLNGPSQPTAPVLSVVDYEPQAELYFSLATQHLAVIIGPEWEAASDAEKKSVVHPLARYLHSIQAKELSPGMAAAGAIVFYSLRRITNPNTKEKLTIAALKVRDWFRKTLRNLFRWKGGDE